MSIYRKRVPLEERKKIDLDLACRMLVMQVADLDEVEIVATGPLLRIIEEARRLRNLLDMRKDGEDAYES